MKILVSGLCGHMGREVAKLALEGYKGAELACGVDPAAQDAPVRCFDSFADADPSGIDCIIDFSHHTGTQALIGFARANKIAVVVATTGQTEEEKQLIKDAASEIPVFFAANFSMGIAVLADLAARAAAAFPEAEVEIVEIHHDRKVDAPSGTALALAEAVKDARGGGNIVCGRSGFGKRQPDDIGVSALRLGNYVGKHTVMIGTQNQTITLGHEAHSRALFAEGALAAAAFLSGKPAGLYDMNSMIKQNGGR